MSISSDFPAGGGGDSVRGYAVYRVNYVSGRKEAAGSILERRRKKRGRKENLIELLVEARRLFGGRNGEAINIILDSPKNAREIKAIAISRGIVAIISS